MPWHPLKATHPAENRLFIRCKIQGEDFAEALSVLYSASKRSAEELIANNGKRVKLSPVALYEEEEDEEEDGGVSVRRYEGEDGDDDEYVEEDDDEGGVDLERDELEEFLDEGERARLDEEVARMKDDDGDWQDANEATDGEEEVLVQPRRSGRAAVKQSAKTSSVARQSRRTARPRNAKPREGGPYDISSYTALDIGPRTLPEWFRNLPNEDKAAGVANALDNWTAYFEKVKSQADLWTWNSVDETCPFTKKILQRLQSPTWPASRFAAKLLSGKDEYGKYLDGLGRLPTDDEIKATRAPTREQLSNFGLYTSLVHNRQDNISGRYTGSGTSRFGQVTRLRQYECLKRMIIDGRKAPPSMNAMNHTSILLQKESDASWRLRASYPRQDADPTLVVIFEAAMVDFEQTLSDDAPSSAVHSAELFAASEQRVPDRTAMAREFVALNRASPYKQGANTGIRNHRRLIFEEADFKCSCCLQVVGQIKSLAFDSRLSWEIDLDYEDATIVCHACCRRWPIQSANGKTADEFVQEMRNRILLRQQKSAADCCLCKKDMPKPNSVFLEGYDGQFCCNACSSDLRKTKVKAGVDANQGLIQGGTLSPDDHRAFVAKRASKSKTVAKNKAGDCCLCKKDMPKPMSVFLEGYDGQFCCSACASALGRAKVKAGVDANQGLIQGGTLSPDDHRAFVAKRASTSAPG
jgi:hypothetical protein